MRAGAGTGAATTFPAVLLALGFRNSQRDPSPRPGRGIRARAVLALVASLAIGCEDEAPVDTPDQAVRAVLEGMQAVHGDPARARVVTERLWEPARKNLAERARRATAATGEEVRPEEMLVPSWFAVDFMPRVYDTRYDGDWAEVTVRPNAGAEEAHAVRCVREEDQWKVALELPPLPPIRKRLDAQAER